VKDKKDQILDARQRDILEGVDAIGTIVDEDLKKMNDRMDQMTETLNGIHKSLTQMKTDHKVLDDNQTDITDSLKQLSDKLNRIEVKLAEGFQKKEFEIIDE